MKKCKYAFDANDEYCKVCNGEALVNADGSTSEVTACPGYEAGSEDIAENSEEDINRVTGGDEPVEEEPAVEEKKPVEPPKQKPVPVKTPKAKEEAVSVSNKKPEKAVEPTDPTPTSNNVPNTSDGVKIRVESGISIEIKSGTWYKFGCSQEETVPVGTEDARRKELWDLVNSQIDAQVAEVTEMVKNTK